MSVTIYDILQADNIRIIRKDDRKGELMIECPECGDARGKCSYNIEKNAVNCFVCGFHGNKYAIHMKARGFTTEEEAYKDMTSGNYGNNASYSIPLQMAAVKAPVTELAPKTQIDEVYKALLSMLTLKDKHKKDLLRRGLSEEQIKKFQFKSLPLDSRPYADALIRRGLELEGVPGFYLNRYGKWCFSTPCEGYFCPVYDGKYLTGMQIRSDTPKNGAKYLWFSSAYKTSGVSSGAIATRLQGSTNVLIVTEGILKATVIWCLLGGRATVIGVPGVASIKNLPMHLVLYRGNTGKVFETYDMDKVLTKNAGEHDRKKQYRISECRDHLKSMVTNYGFKCVPVTWDMNADNTVWNGNIKGFDDYLYSLSEEERDNVFARMENMLIKKSA